MIIFVMVILTVIGIIVAKLYYGNVNRSEDPRVKEAQVMYGRYNEYAAGNYPEKVLALLDSIEDVYNKIPHYRQSFEVGVLYNNRASVYLTKALNDTSVEERRMHYFSMAEEFLRKGIHIYKNWIDRFGNLTENEIKSIVDTAFKEDTSIQVNDNIDYIIDNRVEDIILAQKETPRRLSVSYTNLGIIKRHQNKLKEAFKLYNKALELWSENHAAKNNLNIILGKPVEKQSILRKLFPPEK